ncbi:hypothetical protein EDB86DRAFT_3246880 [Lactarius hatsudake]|nr:hypothetical protein EDB86DRAFT_3246880 [Lactarius hatsudake]
MWKSNCFSETWLIAYRMTGVRMNSSSTKGPRSQPRGYCKTLAQGTMSVKEKMVAQSGGPCRLVVDAIVLGRTRRAALCAAATKFGLRSAPEDRASWLLFASVPRTDYFLSKSTPPGQTSKRARPPLVPPPRSRVAPARQAGQGGAAPPARKPGEEEGTPTPLPGLHAAHPLPFARDPPPFPRGRTPSQSRKAPPHSLCAALALRSAQRRACGHLRTPFPVPRPVFARRSCAGRGGATPDSRASFAPKRGRAAERGASRVVPRSRKRVQGGGLPRVDSHLRAMNEGTGGQMGGATFPPICARTGSRTGCEAKPYPFGPASRAAPFARKTEAGAQKGGLVLRGPRSQTGGGGRGQKGGGSRARAKGDKWGAHLSRAYAPFARKRGLGAKGVMPLLVRAQTEAGSQRGGACPARSSFAYPVHA